MKSKQKTTVCLLCAASLSAFGLWAVGSGIVSIVEHMRRTATSTPGRINLICICVLIVGTGSIACSMALTKGIWKSAKWPKRFSVRSLLALTAVVALVLAVWPRSYSLTQADFNMLKIGMEQSVIEGFIGRPGYKLRHESIIWDPQENGQRISAMVSPGPLEIEFFPTLKDDGHQAVWLTRTGLIAVYFGKDGRLKDKYFSTVHPCGPPPFLYGLEIQASTTRRAER